jgi:threonine dehydrogenase-like Zn-dependent dehydrogenase
MKQVVQSYRTGELKLAHVPAPLPKPGSVLVQTAFSAISLGTEGKKVTTARQSLVGKARSRPDQVQQVLQTVQREGIASAYRKVVDRLDQPISLGYSASGTVIAVGAKVEAFRVGDRVACAGEGIAAHAEVIAVPVNLCVKVPDSVPLEEAAFSTLGAIALQGVRQAEVALGEFIAVIGLGLVGQLTLQLLKAAGCHVIGIDLDAQKAEVAKQMGADWAIVRTDPDLESTVLTLTRGRGADAVIIAAATSSSDPVKLAVSLCRDRGRVVSIGHVGLDLPRQAFYDKDLRFTMSRSYGPGRYDPIYEEKGVDYPIGYVRWTENRNMEAFLDMIAAGKINLPHMITHRFKFEDAEQAYDLLADKRQAGSAPLGVLFEYDTATDHLTPTAQKVLTTESSQAVARAPQATVGVGFVGAGSIPRSDWWA